MSHDSEISESRSGNVHSNKRRFSPIVTVSCLLLCLSGLGLVLWGAMTAEAILETTMVSRDLERVASRLLGLESRLQDVSTFEQMLYRVWGQSADAQDEIRGWYVEALDDSSPPLDWFYLGVLQAEGDLPVDAMQRTVYETDEDEATTEFFRKLLDRTYVHPEHSSQHDQVLQARLAEEVPANWFYFHVAEQLAKQSHDTALEEHLREQFVRFTDPQLWHARVLLGIECSVVGLGVFVLLRLGIRYWRTGQARSQPRDDVRPSPWSFGEGFAVLVRGGAITILLIGGMVLVPNGDRMLETYGSLFLYIPTAILAALLLGRSQGSSLFAVLGFQRPFQVRSSFLPVVVSILTLGLLGDLCIVLGGEAFEWSVNWRDWFLPQLVWGSQEDLLKIGFEVVLLAPVFEEIIFRGLLYTTLRARCTVPISIMGSALIFALAHGYGFVAFLTVFWSGLLWAWAYERTGSLIPGICAHAMNNGLVVYSLVAIFR
ncbi:MAG: CPBP family intramembrane metalloprotease [Nitrospirota bacterium]|nr:CPBP family intramembrane metalloprotease [Nitrospirota bacterium]MDH5587169.1 CPBP family intramembrane metalloprotease [Nitrospirota bacterium]MDH5773397.1 CPBP family intramembrane metalloprotease [Nitrospirota bacterium]